MFVQLSKVRRDTHQVEIRFFGSHQQHRVKEQRCSHVGYVNDLHFPLLLSTVHIYQEFVIDADQVILVHHIDMASCLTRIYGMDYLLAAHRLTPLRYSLVHITRLLSLDGMLGPLEISLLYLGQVSLIS